MTSKPMRSTGVINEPWPSTMSVRMFEGSQAYLNVRSIGSTSLRWHEGDYIDIS